MIWSCLESLFSNILSLIILLDQSVHLSSELRRVRVSVYPSPADILLEMRGIGRNHDNWCYRVAHAAFMLTEGRQKKMRLCASKSEKPHKPHVAPVIHRFPRRCHRFGSVVCQTQVMTNWMLLLQSYSQHYSPSADTTPHPTPWKPVTSGDSASQPRPQYIDNPGPQPSCPAVLISMLSLCTGAAGQ